MNLFLPAVIKMFTLRGLCDAILTSESSFHIADHFYPEKMFRLVNKLYKSVNNL
jgi:hypothetical protein